MRPKGIYVALCLFMAAFLILSSSSFADRKVTHTVITGDTLWDICEHYYGDPWLWPELWEMNQFITNPHWIHPGEVIKLLEYEERKPTPAKRVVKLEEKEPLRRLMGVDVSSITNTKALGSLQQESIEPWGKIFDIKAKKILLGKGDIVYVRMYKEDIKPGDIFTVYSISDPVTHPLTGEALGYVHSFKGILEIEKGELDYHVAKISQFFRTIYRDDLLTPYEPVSPCVLPAPGPDILTAHIVASKDNLDLLGLHSVVYIDAGHDMGVRRGQLLEAIEERESMPDPQKREVVALPPDILGRILILETTENTSNGVVYWVSREFTNGVKVRPQTWHADKQPPELAVLPTCPLE